MHIIVRKVAGGFRARCETDQEWSDLGKTMMEAVGELVHDSLRRFGIAGIGMDLEDEWTQRYVEGKSNRRMERRQVAPISINYDMLPVVSSPEEATRLVIAQLRPCLSRRLAEVLWWAANTLGHGGNDAHLGSLCQHTLAEIIEEERWSYPIGPKTAEKLRELVSHYGLAFKEE